MRKDPFITACVSGNLEAVQQSIQAGRDPNRAVHCPPSARVLKSGGSDEDGFVHPLGVAASNGQLAVVRCLSYFELVARY